MNEKVEQEIIAQYIRNDEEILKENGIKPPQPEVFKSKYWKFTLFFLGIIGLGLIGVFFWIASSKIDALAEERGEVIQVIR